MSDDFGTINVRRGERAREIEVLRQHYRQHREALARMIADAPTEHLASEYQRITVEIDQSLLKLDELEGRTPGVTATVPAHDPAKVHGDPMRPLAVDPGSQQLRTNPQADYEYETDPGIDLPPAEPPARSRVALMMVAALVALGIIGWLVWRASSDRERPVVEESATAPIATESDVAQIETAAEPTGLTATPQSHDYGTIRKGTRATRQFEIANNTDEPITIQVARSACRCLYYEHAPVIPPKAKEALTVTVDGARAKAGELRESVKVTAKADPSVATSFDVIATIQ